MLFAPDGILSLRLQQLRKAIFSGGRP